MLHSPEVESPVSWDSGLTSYSNIKTSQATQHTSQSSSFQEISCLSECLGSSARVQKLFFRNCSMWRWSFDVLGEKVVSLPIHLQSLILP